MTVRHEHRSICREGSVDKGERGLGITRLHKVINKQILLLEVFYFVNFQVLKIYMTLGRNEMSPTWCALEYDRQAPSHFILLFCLLCACVHVHVCIQCVCVWGQRLITIFQIVFFLSFYILLFCDGRRACFIYY